MTATTAAHCNFDGYLQFAVTIAKEAGETIRTAFSQRHGLGSVKTAPINQSNEKKTDTNTNDSVVEAKNGNSSDLVTVTDRAVEQRLRTRIAEQFPNHICIGEEFGDNHGARIGPEPTWIMDPIDGTANFVHGFPFVAVSIGIVVSGHLAVAVVYNPILDELYTAVRGKGAYLNESFRLPLQARPLPNNGLRGCMLGMEYGSIRDDHTLLPKTRSMERLSAASVGHCRGVRCTGSAALNLCLVARGALDAYWEIGIHCWDIAAGALIVEEAGGYVADGAGWYSTGSTTVGSNDRTPLPLDLLNRKILAIRGEAVSRCEANNQRQSIAIEILKLVEDIPQEKD
ncbi:hypothetical protein BDF19DRAFT_448845 [Syncephalis fuscata]|nr:hypothetical protein BDF19DRAFT_448845 [Syncephalis fuscata]